MKDRDEARAFAVEAKVTIFLWGFHKQVYYVSLTFLESFINEIYIIIILSTLYDLLYVYQPSSILESSPNFVNSYNSTNIALLSLS